LHSCSLNPPVDLCRSASADNRTGHARPREHPSNRNRLRGNSIAAGDGAQRVPQGEIAAEAWLLKFRAPAAPVIAGELRDTVGTEAVRQNPGLHRAITNDAGVVALAPGKELFCRCAIYERERWLQRIDVPDRLAPLEQLHIEIGDARRTNFSFSFSMVRQESSMGVPTASGQ
jgi:hypothetical protein